MSMYITVYIRCICMYAYKHACMCTNSHVCVLVLTDCVCRVCTVFIFCDMFV